MSETKQSARPLTVRDLAVLTVLNNGRRIRKQTVTKMVKGQPRVVQVVTVVTRSGFSAQNVKPPTVAAVDSAVKKGLIAPTAGDVGDYGITDQGKKVRQRKPGTTS